MAGGVVISAEGVTKTADRGVVLRDGEGVTKNDGWESFTFPIYTIVDVTPLPNPGRNPEGLARVAREAGVNIVM